MDRKDFRILVNHLLIAFSVIAVLLAAPFVVASHRGAGTTELVAVEPVPQP